MLSRIRSTVTSKFWSATSMKSLLLSMIVWRSCPAPPNASAELLRDDLEVVLVHAAHGLVEVGEQGVGLDRGLGEVARDLGAVLEVGARVALRLQLDVLLTDGGAVADQRAGIGGDLVVLVVDVEQDVDAVVGEHQLLHLPDADAAVGHLGALERTAGVAEVGDHGVALVHEHPVQLGVAGTHERHADERDDREDEQLHPGPAW